MPWKEYLQLVKSKEFSGILSKVVIGATLNEPAWFTLKYKKTIKAYYKKNTISSTQHFRNYTSP